MWLAIDTATDRASVAVGASGATASEEHVEGSRRHAAALLPMVQRLLAARGARLADLRGVVVSDGPGSFTGLRVAAAAAKALVQTRRIELWSAPSLMVRAAALARDDGATLVAVADALRGEVYAAAYRFHPRRVETVLPASVWRRDDLVARFGAGATLVTALPRASSLLDLVGRAGGAQRVTDVHAWEPEYGRPAEAQARWELAHGRPLPGAAGDGG